MVSVAGVVAPPTTHVSGGEAESPQVHLQVTRVPRRFACSFGPTTLRLVPMGLDVPIMGPGATVGPVDSRVCIAHSPRAAHATASTKRLRTKPTAWRVPPEGETPGGDLRRRQRLEGGPPEGVPLEGSLPLKGAGPAPPPREPRAPEGILHGQGSAAERTWALLRPQGDARDCAHDSNSVTVAVPVIKGVNKALCPLRRQRSFPLW